MDILLIAIDGPAGAGKSTIAKIVAERLNILYLDTGSMYRAMALKMLNNNVDPGDLAKVIPYLDSTTIDITYDDGNQSIYLDGSNVSSEIRSPEVSSGASDIAVIPEVRI